MVSIRRYTAADKKEWDGFVALSKNATFLHYRDYMDYHSDRFSDFSLMAFDGGRLLALLPANLSGDTLYSHQGLTFGGWLMPLKHFNANTMLDVFGAMMEFLRDCGIKRLVYKAIPHIYHKYPAEEDLYALFRHNARILVTNMSSTVDLAGNGIPMDTKARRNMRIANEKNVEVECSEDFRSFWKILSENLWSRYGASPVHTLEEIEFLHNRFPANIRLYGAFYGGSMVAGIVTYEDCRVVHAQYLSATPEGFAVRAVAKLVSYLYGNVCAGKKYFDFGTSNEDNGLYLNRNLIETKFEYGGRGVAYTIYEITV